MLIAQIGCFFHDIHKVSSGFWHALSFVRIIIKEVAVYSITTQGHEYLREQSAISGRQLQLAHSTKFQMWGSPEGEPCVLLHGLAGGLKLIQPLASELGKQGLCVYSYELRDEDRAVGVRTQHTFQDLVSDLHEFIQNRRLERPWLLGVSFGSLLALHYASLFPNRVAGVTLQGVGPRFDSTVLKQVASSILGRLDIPVESFFVKQFFNLFMGTKFPDERLRDDISSMIWSTDQAVINHRFRLASEFDVSALGSNLKNVPMLALRGDRDVVVSSGSFGRFTQALPHIKLKEIATAGHLACVTHHQEMAKTIRQFI